MNRMTNDQYKAYAAGRKANQNGLLERDCPFDGLDPASRELRDQWLEGWMEFQETERAAWEESHDYVV